MKTSIAIFVFVLASAILVASCADLPSPRFSWVSRVPNRVRSLTKEELSSGEVPAPKFGLDDFSVRIVKRAGDLSLHDLARDDEQNNNKLSKTVVRPAADDSAVAASTSSDAERPALEASTTQTADQSQTGTESETSSPNVETAEENQTEAEKTTDSNEPSEQESSETQTKSVPDAAELQNNDQDQEAVAPIKPSTSDTSTNVDDSATPSEGVQQTDEQKPTESSTETNPPTAEGLEASSRKAETDENIPKKTTDVEKVDGIKSGKSMFGMIFPSAKEIFSTNSIPSSVKFVDQFVNIGKNKFSRDRVTDVGDVDGNGFTDYVVSNPSAQNKTGSVRLYLMKDNDGFLFSRELVPGSWGFSGAELREGDEYGKSVLKLPSGNTSTPCVLVVGAPGDNAKGKKKGAVYILRINEKGQVLKNVKVSADTEKSLALQHENEEGFGTDIRAIGDLNGDGEFELAVKSVLGATTMLFLNSKYEVKTGLKIHNNDNSGMLGIVEKYIPTKSNKLDATSLDSISIRASIPGQCFYNETACACSLKSPDKGSASCLDAVALSFSNGRTICNTRDCQPSYVCSCDGNELCIREEQTRSVYVAEEALGADQVYCSKQEVKMSVNVVQEGQAVPSVSSAETLSAFNETNCRCSPKREVVAPYQCLDFKRTDIDKAVICSSRECQIGENEYVCDGMGSWYCKRELVTRIHFVNDGPLSDEENAVYCHAVSSSVEIVTRVED